MARYDIALGKAWCAVAMSCSSRALGKRAKDNPNFFLTLAATAKGKYMKKVNIASTMSPGLLLDETAFAK